MPIDRPAALVAATLLIAGLSWSSPRWAVALLLAALPFFTHHPSSFPAVLILSLVTALELVYVLRARPSLARTWQAVSSQPLLLLCALFVGAAFLSLSSLPLGAMWRDHAAAASTQSWKAWPGLLLEWILLTEVRPEFSITSAVLVLQAFVLALIVWRETRASSATALLFSMAITLGTVVFVALGLLEAFGAVNLDTVRGTGGVTFREGTLQSASGNPGWFSEYVVYTMPYALALLAGASAAGVRLALLTGVIGLMALALLVSFQRGGWISGAVVMAYMVVAAASLLSRSRPPGRAARRDVVRALALVGVVVALAAGGFSFWMAKSRAGVTGFNADAYLVRLKSIANADRLIYVRVGSMIAALHPVLGGGHESFAYRYHMYFDTPGGIYEQSTARVIEPASAHNVFVQTLTGTGTVGLALLVSIFAVAAWTTVRVLRSAESDRTRCVVLLAGSGSLLGIACYGLVQEVFYIHALRLLFFVSVGLVAGVATDTLRWPAGLRRALWLALALAFLVHLGYEYAWPGPDRLLR